MSKQHILEEMSKFDEMTLSTAYIYAKNLTLYGVDVTEKWLTATQNSVALEKAYKKGYYDALQKQTERSDNE